MRRVSPGAIAIGAMLVSSCVGQPPDEVSFVEFVASLCTDAVAKAQHAKSIAIDSACFPRSMPTLRAAIEHRLSNTGVTWFPIEASCTVAKLPGPWQSSGPDSMDINLAHEMLFVSLGGSGTRRTLHIGYLCGPVCGSGEMLEAIWDGHRWKEANRHPVIY
jgi:hypothetical protein